MWPAGNSRAAVSLRAIGPVFLALTEETCWADQGLVGTYQPQHGYLGITPKVMVSFFAADARKIGASTEAKAALLARSVWEKID